MIWLKYLWSLNPTLPTNEGGFNQKQQLRLLTMIGCYEIEVDTFKMPETGTIAMTRITYDAS